MFIFRKLFSLDGGIYFSTPDPASGGGAGTADGVQAPAQGAAPAQGDAGFRQYFPNVPDEHWGLIEPHVGQIEAHTTQLQQQLAPFKPFLESGMTPDQATGLMNFSAKFDANPLQTWLELGQMLQQSSNGAAPALHPDVDLEYLAAIARGEDPDEGSVPGQPQGLPGADPAAPGAANVTPEMQALLQHVQHLQGQLAELQTGQQQQEVQRQTAIQDQLYERRLGQMREALTGGGWPEDLVSDEMMSSYIITHRGDFAAATKSLLDQRSNLLKGFVQNRETPNPTELPNGVPSTPSREVPRRDQGDPFKRATRSAEARLKRANGTG